MSRAQQHLQLAQDLVALERLAAELLPAAQLTTVLAVVRPSVALLQQPVLSANFAVRPTLQLLLLLQPVAASAAAALVEAIVAAAVAILQTPSPPLKRSVALTSSS